MLKKQGDVRGMGFTCLAFGGIFLFNPIVAVVDVLPNVIGYLLIYAGLWKLADLNDEFASAHRLARTMIWVGFLEILLWWICYSYLPDVVADPAINASPHEPAMAVLLCSVVSAILNFCFLLPMLKNLFAGFANAAIRCDQCVVNRERRGVSLWERMTKKSVRFVIFASVLAVLPELTILTTLNLLSDKPTVAFDWYPFAPLFRGGMAVVVAVFGLIWLVSYLRFFFRVKKDIPFYDSLQTRYKAEVLPQTNWLLYRRCSVAFFCATVGLIFSAQLRFDSRTLLPGFACAVLLCTAVAIIGTRGMHGAPIFYMLGAILAVISGTHEYCFARYMKNHDLEDALHLPTAYTDFYQVRVLQCVEAIATVAFLSAFFWIVWQFLVKLIRMEEGGLFAKSKSKFAVRLVLTALFAVGAAIFGSINAFLQLEIKYLWWIALLFTTIMLLLCRGLLVEIKEEILSRAESDRMHKKHQGDAY